MLWRLRNTLQRFFYGRYGADQLNNTLLVLYLVVWLVNLFVRTWILTAAELLLLGYILFRMLSRNISRRQAENARFMKGFVPFRSWCRFQRDRIRDIGRWRYRKCKYCHAAIRVPIRRGRRTVTCPRCHGRFRTFFL